MFHGERAERAESEILVWPKWEPGPESCSSHVAGDRICSPRCGLVCASCPPGHRAVPSTASLCGRPSNKPEATGISLFPISALNDKSNVTTWQRLGSKPVPASHLGIVWRQPGSFPDVSRVSPLPLLFISHKLRPPGTLTACITKIPRALTHLSRPQGALRACPVSARRSLQEEPGAMGLLPPHTGQRRAVRELLSTTRSAWFLWLLIFHLLSFGS